MTGALVEDGFTASLKKLHTSIPTLISMIPTTLSAIPLLLQLSRINMLSFRKPRNRQIDERKRRAIIRLCFRLRKRYTLHSRKYIMVIPRI